MTTLKFNGERVFRIGQKIAHKYQPNKQKEDKEVTNAEKEVMNRLARGITARAKDEAGIRVQVGPPPPVILARTEAQKRVAEHYEKPETIRTNVNDIKGMESYEPPPCILAPVEED